MKLKFVVFSLLPLLSLACAVELGVRAFYFQSRSGNRSGFELLYENAAKFYATRIASDAKSALANQELLEKRMELLYRPAGAAMLRELQANYSRRLAEFAALARESGARVLFLYIPSQIPSFGFSYREFFRTLAENHAFEFVDMSPVFALYPWKYITLEPEDPHLSRFGNQLVAETLATRLAKFREYRSPRKFSPAERPALFGDLKPNNKTVWELGKPIAFVANVNAQGLRNSGEFSFPKTGQRVLCLGDSFTFGLYVPSVHTFPHLLGQLLPGTEVANAGVSGYTIPDQVELFRERARFLEPDLIVLQVYDNDLTDQFHFQRAHFARDRARAQPSATETAFFELLRKP